MIEAMTTPTRTARRPGWVAVFLAAVLAVATGLLGAGPASAATTPAAQNAVGASNSAAAVVVGPDAGITAGQRVENDPARARIVVATGVAANTASLEARVAEVHGVLDPIAQTSRTTAALGTREGTTVIGGGVRDLSPAQRALIGDGEMMAGGPGHAEVTTVLGARGAGLTPQEIVTSWDICPACQTFLRNEGATLTGPRSARW